ncbi:winged helix-turn-helix transcriptional regulator [Candidatus Bathyarchaeota archaeon]|nr:winged helix-turn-helix transcriptional regulator [Candidatus Bathyarchaeota archaeon]
MKLIRFLNQEGQNLISDPTNLTILRELVNTDLSVSDLAIKFNLPTLKVWRRIQKLEKAQLIELTGTQKNGNNSKETLPLNRRLLRT